MSALYTCEMNVSDAQLTGADRRLPVRLKRLHYQQRSPPSWTTGRSSKKKLITSMKTDAKERGRGAAIGTISVYIFCTQQQHRRMKKLTKGRSCATDKCLSPCLVSFQLELSKQKNMYSKLLSLVD